jgi:hypothetical protein
MDPDIDQDVLIDQEVVAVTRAPAPRYVIPFKTLDLGIEFRFRGVDRLNNGTPIGEMIDEVLIVPPLNFYNLKRLGKAIDGVTTADNLISMENLIEILIAALSQNYQGIPRWLIEQSIGLGNSGELAAALMDISGLKRKQIEAEKKAAALVNSTGTTSITT